MSTSPVLLVSYPAEGLISSPPDSRLDLFEFQMSVLFQVRACAHAVEELLRRGLLYMHHPHSCLCQRRANTACIVSLVMASSYQLGVLCQQTKQPNSLLVWQRHLNSDFTCYRHTTPPALDGWCWCQQRSLVFVLFSS